MFADVQIVARVLVDLIFVVTAVKFLVFFGHSTYTDIKGIFTKGVHLVTDKL